MRRLVAFLILIPFVGCHRDDVLFIIVGGPWPTDFNSGGFAEILIGSPLADAGVVGSDRGAVYLYAGGTGPDTVADKVYLGTENGGQFGRSVSAIGDYNGDGYPDFAVGAPFEAGGGTQRGNVYIYFGGPSFPTASSVVIPGFADNGRFGWSVARAGDVNGDGRDELLVGAPYEAGGGTQRGRAYVFSFTGGTTPIQTFVGANEDNAHFGEALDTAGDMNGDGYFDVAIGAPLDDAGSLGSNRGRVYVYFGGPGGPDATADLTLSGVEDNSQFGTSVAGLLDYNTDGFGDLAVGAPLDDGDTNTTDEGTDAGRVFVFFGAVAPSTTAARIMTGAAGSHFGAMVARIGDINAGGAPDLLVGAPLDAGTGLPGSQRGRAFIFFGGPTSDTTADINFFGAVDMGHFGASGFSGGDVEGDGYRDLVIGAPEDGTNGANAGRVYFFRGGPSMDNVSDGSFDAGAEAGARAGASVQ